VKLPTYQDLSKEQDAVNNLPMRGNYLVTGPPGTGKTVMALYRCKMLSEREEPARLLMHGNLLSQYTNHAVEELGIDGTVSTFHKWMWSWSKTTWGKTPPQLAPYVHDWQTIVEWAIAKPPEKDTMPHLLVDEGQDMPEKFYVFARSAARQLTVFADENQRIKEENSTLQEIRDRVRPDFEAKLTRNYRNTIQIARVASAFYRGAPTGIPELPDRAGPRPMLNRHAKMTHSVQQVVDFATNFRRQHIGVIVPNNKVMKKYVNRLATHLPDQIPVQFYRSGEMVPSVVDFSRTGVTVVNWASAKGLEFDTVFLPELQDQNQNLEDPTLHMQLYVLCSRARERLFFSYSGDGEPAIIKLFPMEHIEDSG